MKQDNTTSDHLTRARQLMRKGPADASAAFLFTLTHNLVSGVEDMVLDGRIDKGYGPASGEQVDALIGLGPATRELLNALTSTKSHCSNGAAATHLLHTMRPMQRPLVAIVVNQCLDDALRYPLRIRRCDDRASSPSARAVALETRGKTQLVCEVTRLSMSSVAQFAERLRQSDGGLDIDGVADVLSMTDTTIGVLGEVRQRQLQCQEDIGPLVEAMGEHLNSSRMNSGSPTAVATMTAVVRHLHNLMRRAFS